MTKQATTKDIENLLNEDYKETMTKPIKLQTSNLFRTFETQEEAVEFINSHSLPEERRLLWLGFAFGCNYTANQVNKTFKLTYKK